MHSGTTKSVWMDDRDTLSRPSLSTDTTADICVVGAGIAGLSVAYHLTKEGKSVVVLDDGPIGGGETVRTTAHLVNALDDRFYKLEKLFGSVNARLAYESHTAAINRIEEIVKEQKIDCDFARLDGYLFVSPDGNKEELDLELAATKHIDAAVEKADRVPWADFDTGRCLRFRHQGQFHPMRYLAGLAKAIEAGGGQIYTGTHVVSFEGRKESHILTSDGRRVHASFIVAATNSPVNDRVAIHTKQAAYRTFVIALQIPKGYVEKALYWDTSDPYHYVRIQEEKDHDVLIVGGEDHKTGQTNDGGLRFTRLEEWTRERFPKAGEILHSWSGQVMEPVDSLAFIGRNPLDSDNVLIATGDSGNGMTHGTIAGMLISDLILGRANPWADLYDPSRKTVKATMSFMKENMNVAKEYMDLVTDGDVQSEENIREDSGAVIRKGLRKIALYRDDKGTLHRFSAICPHLGCIVSWNSTEKTWDCPCHGSRYLADGTVVNGPSSSNLKPVE